MQIKFLAAVLTVSLAGSLPSSACINETGTTRSGQQVDLMNYGGDRLKPYLITPTSQANTVEWSKYVVEDVKKRPSPDNLNGLAVVLIRFGRLPEAIKLLQHLEKVDPGRYEFAANMGTAFELMGRNEDALKWIREGMKRNSDAHHGTEWLHVRILEHKLGRRAKPSTGRSILSLDFGIGAVPTRPVNLPMDNRGRPVSLFGLGHALRYQVTERIQFVAAPEPIVAGLLLDWANLELLAGTLESADVIYDAALRYGSTDRQLIALRKAEIKRVLAAAKGKGVTEGASCELCEPPREKNARP